MMMNLWFIMLVFQVFDQHIRYQHTRKYALHYLWYLQSSG